MRRVEELAREVPLRDGTGRLRIAEGCRSLHECTGGEESLIHDDESASAGRLKAQVETFP